MHPQVKMRYTIEEAENSRAWPFIEAAKLLKALKGQTPAKGYVLFVTGYGPSGLPHIGTFAEVLRTTMVRKAFTQLCDIPTKLICFSDDLDGLRKVPTNLPNQDMLANYLDYPLTSVPDPFGEQSSYGAYMNNKLCSFLDHFEFEYELYSATEYYNSGKFDFMLMRVLDRYEQIMQVMLPTLGDERRATYSPFMPICPKTNKVLQVPVLEIHPAEGTIVYQNTFGEHVETLVTGGRCKLQWKPDFAMRWAALSVDYEMYGKDHLPNSKLYSRICEILDGVPPVQLFYELFLNEQGSKISKSKGNSITIDEWLAYAPVESMSLFMYQHPSRAKKLYFAVIPKAVDEYLILNRKYHQTTDQSEKVANPVYHIHGGEVPQIETYDLTFNLILNLATVCNAEDDQILWNFIKQYNQSANKENAPYLSKLVNHAVRYYNTFIREQKEYLAVDAKYKEILVEIVTYLETINDIVTAEEIQKQLYDIGMKYCDDLRQYFSTLYQILIGQAEGPRLGSFIKLYTIQHTIILIKSKLSSDNALT